MSFANGSSNTQFSGYAWGNGVVTGLANTSANAIGSSFTMPNRRGKVACWRSSLSEGARQAALTFGGNKWKQVAAVCSLTRVWKGQSEWGALPLLRCNIDSIPSGPHAG